MADSKENISITQYGEDVAELTDPVRDRVEVAKSLFGILPQTITWEEAREELLAKNECCSPDEMLQNLNR